MGTSLTGTKPKDTYDSLIKVGDNGPISGTAKTLSDGLGNDLPISVSTSNVGIGTSAPDTKLQVAGTGATGFSIRANTSGDAFMRYYLGSVIASDAYVDRATGNLNIRSNQNGSSIVFSTAAALVERFRITDNGVTFNGDTAAANALDDYEEGTWTITATPSTSGSITLGTNGGTYTKIGRQVTCVGRAVVGSVSSPVGAYVIVGGLPFTSLNLVAGQSAVGVYFADASAGYASSNIAAYIPNNATTFFAFKDASTIAASDEIAFTVTYFV
jgi:hypothetical protein